MDTGVWDMSRGSGLVSSLLSGSYLDRNSFSCPFFSRTNRASALAGGSAQSFPWGSRVDAQQQASALRLFCEGYSISVFGHER